MNWDAIDWNGLARMRGAFLEGKAGQADYWQRESDLASYDATFAQRIGWKWDYVLAELTRRGWNPPHGALLDWGCGSGIAHRAFLDHFGSKSVASLHLWDRSPLAMAFAQKGALAKYPGLSVASGKPDKSAAVLISHVLTELDDGQIEELADHAAARTTSILWVEPGSHDASHKLIAIRERLRAQFNIVAPCVHQGQCGILAAGNERHWCHHFATPPPEIFSNGNWTRFGQIAGVDLRSLPLSFLVLDKRPVPALPEGATRILGHPRVYKGYALALGSGSAGLQEHQINKRLLPDLFRAAKKEKMDPLQAFQTEDGKVVEAKPLFSPGIEAPSPDLDSGEVE